jgi:hypothetical protein
MLVQAMPYPANSLPPTGFVAAGAGAEVAISGGGSGAAAVPYPAGISAGLVLFLHVVQDWASGTGTVTTPAGWTLAGQHGLSGQYNHFLFWKYADGSESGTLSVATSFTGAGTTRGVISAWSGITAGTPYTSLVNNEPAFGTNVTSGTVVTDGAGEIVINFCASHNAHSFTPPAGYTEAYDTAGGGNALTANYEIAGAAGSVGPSTTVCSSADDVGVMSLALRVPTAAPTFSVNPSISSASGFYGTGDVLTGSPGTHNGGSESHQWKRDGVAIGGETGLAYTLQAADAGAAITFTVTAYTYVGLSGSSRTAVSAPVTGTGDPVYSTQTRTLSDSSNRTLSDSSDRTISNRTA